MDARVSPARERVSNIARIFNTIYNHRLIRLVFIMNMASDI